MAPRINSGQPLGSVHTVPEVGSIVNSQLSSFDETIASQSSCPLPLSPELHRPLKANPFPGEITPATSFSDPSSQELPAGNLDKVHHSQSRTEAQPDSRTRPLSSGSQCSTSPSRRSPTLLDDHKVSNKRMANGEVKHAEHHLSSPVEQQGHTRNTSASRSSQIGEASLADFGI